MLALASLFLLASTAMVLHGGELTGGTIEGIESEQVQSLVVAVTGHSVDTTVVAVFHDATWDARSSEFHEAMQRALQPLRSDPDVTSIITPDDGGPLLAPRMINGKAHAGLAFISLRGDVKTALVSYGRIRGELQSDRLRIACTGRVPFLHDMDKTLSRDLLRAEIVSLPLALLVLVLAFRTLVAAALPVGVGALAVLGGIAGVLALSHVTDIAEYTINVCSLVGLGVAIDYSLFTVSRFREEIAAGFDVPNALARALETSGRVVLFSGLAVATGLAGLMFFEGSYLRAMGIGGAIVVALSVVFALTVLPALLAVLGHRVNKWALPGAESDMGAGLWHRLAETVMRRPVMFAVPTLAALIAVGIPFLHLEMATSDVRVLDGETDARRAYDELKADFPDEAADRLVVAVRFPTSPALDEARIGALYDLSRRMRTLPGVTKVESIVDGDDWMEKDDYVSTLLHPDDIAAPLVAMAKKLTVGERVVLLNVVTEAPPESEIARGLVRTIREHRAVADGELLIGGPAANDVDTTTYVRARAPKAIALVVGVTFVVLFLLFGSIVLPLKAIAMNFLSIAGSFGALVWVFQDGHLFVKEPRPVEPSLPILLFCVLFGLSMDYEVLMLSRMHESYRRHRDNTRAVAEGLERTGRLVTSAAVIMVAVFGAFALARVVLIKAVGFGMALAVALDATLVRALLVPATMRLFGDLNWWAPRWLKALRKSAGFERESTRPRTESAS